MTTLAIHRHQETNAIALPEPRAGAVSIRVGTEDDLPFIDALQKKHSRMVGFLMLPVLKGHMKHGRVLIAEQTGIKASRDQGTEEPPDARPDLMPGCLDASMPVPVGYILSNDRYFKRDDCGIVYQLNVVPGKQRGLIGATLIKAAFDRAAYGCRLFCCWCAQDLEANRFWESIGFVPLAFRTGSRRGVGKSKEPRIHIFWQRRIREGDVETPYWFPAETTGGAINQGRIVLPIPPGTHWSDAKPAILPGMDEAMKSLPEPEKSIRGREKKVKIAAPAPPKRKGGLWFGARPPEPGSPEAIAAKKAASGAKVKEPKAPRPRVKLKNDPKLIAAARELRDRYIEEINAARGTMLPPSACGKYDVSRQLEGAPSAMKIEPARMLEAA